MFRWVPGRRAWLVVAIVSGGFQGVEAARAAGIWRSNATLWRAAVAREPASARAWTGLSRQLRNEGDLAGADQAVARALALDPSLLRARVTAVYNALARGDVDLARRLISDLERRGGAEQLGMREARRCATLPADQAAACVGFRPLSVEPGPGGRR